MQITVVPPPASVYYQQVSRHSDEGGISNRVWLFSIRFLAALEMTGRFLKRGREQVPAELKQATFLPPPASAFYQKAGRHSDDGGISTQPEQTVMGSVTQMLMEKLRSCGLSR
ncbi:hypothetical protein DSECCO2_429660 [anaerobic digester metagenome]